jgi:hypothetical protein
MQEVNTNVTATETKAKIFLNMVKGLVVAYSVFHLKGFSGYSYFIIKISKNQISFTFQFLILSYDYIKIICKRVKHNVPVKNVMKN